VLNGHRNAVFSVAYARDGTALASGGTDNTVILWDAATAQPRWRFQHTGNIHCLLFSADGGTVVTGDAHGDLVLINAADGTLRSTLPAGAGLVDSLAISRDGAAIAMGCEDGQLVLWDAASWSVESRLRLPEPVISCAFSPDGRAIACGGWGRAIARVAIASAP
jgi:WD40 repeat protein